MGKAHRKYKRLKWREIFFPELLVRGRLIVGIILTRAAECGKFGTWGRSRVFNFLRPHTWRFERQSNKLLAFWMPSGKSDLDSTYRCSQLQTENF